MIKHLQKAGYGSRLHFRIPWELKQQPQPQPGPTLAGSEFIGIEHGPDAGAFENLPDGSDVQQSLRTALGQCKILNGKFPSFCQ